MSRAARWPRRRPSPTSRRTSSPGAGAARRERQRRRRGDAVDRGSERAGATGFARSPAPRRRASSSWPCRRSGGSSGSPLAPPTSGNGPCGFRRVSAKASSWQLPAADRSGNSPPTSGSATRPCGRLSAAIPTRRTLPGRGVWFRWTTLPGAQAVAAGRELDPVEAVRPSWVAGDVDLTALGEPCAPQPGHARAPRARHQTRERIPGPSLRTSTSLLAAARRASRGVGPGASRRAGGFG